MARRTETISKGALALYIVGIIASLFAGVYVVNNGGLFPTRLWVGTSLMVGSLFGIVGYFRIISLRHVVPALLFMYLCQAIGIFFSGGAILGIAFSHALENEVTAFVAFMYGVLSVVGYIVLTGGALLLFGERWWSRALIVLLPPDRDDG